MAEKKAGKVKQGEVLPSEKEKPSSSTTVDIRALINHFSERPDLMLEAFEKHDKGFIKRMNKRIEADEVRTRESRFQFGKFQAYTSLVIKVMAALFCLYLLYLAVTGGGLAFFVIIAVTVFYAISQNGTEGFYEIAKALAQRITNRSKGNNKDD